MELLVILLLFAMIVAEERYKRIRLNAEVHSLEKKVYELEEHLTELRDTCVYLQLKKN